jgi:hypothetical protein
VTNRLFFSRGLFRFFRFSHKATLMDPRESATKTGEGGPGAGVTQIVPAGCMAFPALLQRVSTVEKASP